MYLIRTWKARHKSALSGCPVCGKDKGAAVDSYPMGSDKGVWVHKGRVHCLGCAHKLVDRTKFKPQHLFRFCAPAELMWRIQNDGRTLSSVVSQSRRRSRRMFPPTSADSEPSSLKAILITAMDQDWTIKRDENLAKLFKPALRWMTQEKMHLLLVELRQWRDANLKKKHQLGKGKGRMPKVENGGRIYSLSERKYKDWFQGKVLARIKGLAQKDQEDTTSYYQSYDLAGDVVRTDKGMRLKITLKRGKD